MQGAKNILITGTNKGLGHHLVKLFLQRHPGYIIYATSRQPIQKVQASFDDHDPNKAVRHLSLDVRSPQNIVQVADYLGEKGVKIDMLINNAGVFQIKSKTEYPRLPEATIDLETNLLGVINLTEALLPYLTPSARIVNVSSGLGGSYYHPPHTSKRFSNPEITKEEVLQGMREFLEGVGKKQLEDWYENSYATSKFLLNSWTRFVLPRQLKEGQIGISMSPGLCRTDMTEGYLPQIKGHTCEDGAQSIYQTCFIANPNGQKFYHRMREVDFVTCGTQTPKQT